MCIVNQFLYLVKARSAENNQAFQILYEKSLYSVCVGLFRQELDSLIRLCYLHRLEESDGLATSLMKDTIDGKKWKYHDSSGKLKTIRDFDMLALACHLGGWEQVIYAFGCKAIHLSDLHGYLNFDPFSSISEVEKNKIIGYLKDAHEYSKETISMQDIFEYLPKVMKKLVDNIEYYIEELEVRYTQL